MGTDMDPDLMHNPDPTLNGMTKALQFLNNPTTPNLTFSAQNCNSLNLTGLSKNFSTKVSAITSCKSDVILLSDIRLLGCNGVKNDERVFNAFRDSSEKS